MTANDPYALFDVTDALDKNLYICGMVFAQIVTGTHIGSGPVWFTSHSEYPFSLDKTACL